MTTTNTNKNIAMDILGGCREMNINPFTLRDRICGIMSYNESADEFNFITTYAYPHTSFENLPIAYLHRGIRKICDILTEARYSPANF